MNQKNQHYKFINTPLPYSYKAMLPYIDEKTMILHHDRHLQTYVDNLNKALSNYPQFYSWSLDELIENVAMLPTEIQKPVKNNAGGVYAHQFYFNNLTNAAYSHPCGLLVNDIIKEFGSLEEFIKQFKAAALSVFGSGYAWLVVNSQGTLEIITTANQDTPLSLGLCPVLNVDVWEHAYYLKHYNLRGDYINDWFQVINWSHATKLYKCCLGLG